MPARRVVVVGSLLALCALLAGCAPWRPETLCDEEYARLRERMDDADPDVRLKAVERLGHFVEYNEYRVTDARAVAALIESLGDRDCRVRFAAATDLGGCIHPGAGEVAIGALWDPDPETARNIALVLASGIAHRHRLLELLVRTDVPPGVRAAIAEALGRWRMTAASGEIVTALGAGEMEVRRSAAFAAGLLKDPWVVSALLAALRQNETDVRANAARSLGRLGDTRAIDPLCVAAGGDAEESVREAAVRALGDMKATSAMPTVCGALTDSSSDVQIAAAEVLGQWQDRRAADALAAAVNDPKTARFVQQRAAIALGRCGDARAIDPLFALLTTGEWVVSALEALGWIRHPRSIAFLKGLILAAPSPDDGSWLAVEFARAAGAEATPLLIDMEAKLGRSYGRERVLTALGLTKDPRAIKPLVEILHHPAEEDWAQRKRVTETAAAALAEIGHGDATKALLAAARSWDEDVQEAAVLALGRVDGEEVTDLLIDALGWDSAGFEAARALTGRPRPGVVPRLIAALDDWRSYRRANAAGCLRHIGDARAVEPLIRHLNTWDRDLLWSVIWALREIGDDRAVGPLIPFLRHRRETTRRSAAYALGYLGDRRALGPLIEAVGTTCGAAIRSLSGMTGQYLGNDREAWRAWWREQADAESTTQPAGG